MKSYVVRTYYTTYTEELVDGVYCEEHAIEQAKGLPDEVRHNQMIKNATEQYPYDVLYENPSAHPVREEN